MREVWKTIKSFNGVIAASNFGRIRREISGRAWNAKAGLIYTSALRKDGYLQVNINGMSKLVHYLVCEAFNGEKPTAKHQCNHKDGNRQNNTPQNLEWVTSSENNFHRFRQLKCRTNAKRYKIYPPNSEPFEIENLRKFCFENNLTNSNMVSVLKGRQSNHKGWRVEYA